MVRARRGRRAPRRRAAGRRVARKGKRSAPAKQYATIQETIALTDMIAGVDVSYDFNLSQFRRATDLATNFKWYKATKVIWTLEPLYNTFQDGATGNEISAPYLYNVMNRTQDSRLHTLLDFQAMGSRPQKFTSKKVISYTPNWCSSGLTTFTKDLSGNYLGGTSQGLKAQYSYLACPDDRNKAPNIGQGIVPNDPRDPNPTVNTGLNTINANQVIYNGHIMFVDQLVFTADQPVARMTCTVTWLFKDPNFTSFLRDPPAAIVSA